MPELPVYIPAVFVLTTLFCIYLFCRAYSVRAWLITGISLAWPVLQGIVAYTGFYTRTDVLPPRFLLLVWPPLILIICLFIFKGGRRFLDGLDQKALTLVHVVRIPVELVLYWLFVGKMVPELMTFTGRNFDILAGLSAPLIWYFGYVKPKLGRSALLAWNFFCLALLINIIVNGVLSAPFPFQQFSFEQPNRGLLYFPYVWLPCYIVPVVLLSHLVAVRQLMLTE